MMTRLFLYLLAMMTGFSAAEAARPVAATPASVGVAVDHMCAAVAIKVSEQTQERPAADTSLSILPFLLPSLEDALSSVEPTTPVRLHDLILG